MKRRRLGVFRPWPVSGLLSFATATIVLGLSSHASAEKATDARLIVSAERLTGFHFWKAKVDPQFFPETEADGLMFNFLVANNNPADGVLNVNPFATPRIAFDGVINQKITVGGFFGIAHTSGDVNGADLPDTTAFAFGPRAGYLHSFSETLALWPRGGITVVRIESDTGPVEVGTTAFDLTLEGLLVITPVSHAGITAGLTADIGLGGETDAAGGNSDVNLHNVGVVAGFALLF